MGDQIEKTQQSSTPQPRATLELIILALAVLTGFGLRYLLQIPKDLGGTFLQIWASVVGLIYLGIEAELKIPRSVSRAIVLPVICFLAIAPVFYAPQALFPFFFTMILAVAGYLLCSEGKPQYLLAWTGCALLLLWAVSGVRHMLLVSHLRHLRADEVIAVSFPGRNQRVASRQTIERLTYSLRHMSPYSPNHEGEHQPRTMQIDLRSGESITFTVANGNRANARTAWVGFGFQVYQNAPLYEVLTSEISPPLWTSSRPRER